MLLSLRGLLIAVISVSLICSPLVSRKVNANHDNPEQKRDLAQISSQLPDHTPNELLIKFDPAVSQENRDFILRSAGKSHKRLRGGGDVYKLSLREDLDLIGALNSLRRLDRAVDWVEPNYLMKRAGEARHASSRPRPRANKSPRRSKAEISTTLIAVIDTGVDLQHPELKNVLWRNTDERSGLADSDQDGNGYAGDSRGWNFIDDSSDVNDDNGHGTQIAGVIAKSSPRDSQSAIRILPLKALNNSGVGTIADVVEAMDYAVARRAAVVNLSFGAPAYSRALLEGIKRAETSGVLVVAAAGNEGKSLERTGFYPASYRSPNLISVAALDATGELSPFSNYGADIAAPGVNIRTAHRNRGDVYMTGTSAAAGYVSAAAGLLKSRRGWVSAQTIRDAILKSASEPSNPFVDLKEKLSSKGLVNQENALAFFLRENHIPAAPRPVNRRMTPAVKAAIQGGNGDLDTLRSSQPQAPNAYVQTGILPLATYDDPKPANMANFDSYLTQLTGAVNATGVAGRLPQQSADPTAGSASVGGMSINLDSQNFNFTLPVASLPGRAGLGLSLGLSYNNRIWIRDPNTNTNVFNLDRGFPAPGWRIGFGLIQIKNNTSGPYVSGFTGKNAVCYIEPDGTRHELSQNPTTLRYESYDSSYLSFDVFQQILYFPDGTKMLFGAFSYDPNVRDFQEYPVEIKDRNGNYITIAYKTLSTQKVAIDYAIDTAGRRIDFNYQNNKLVSVSQIRNGSVYKYINIDYSPVTIQGPANGGALDPVNINGAQVYFPSRVTYPTGVHYRFGHNVYGEISVIEKWAPTISGQGNERKIASTTFGNYIASSATPVFRHRIEWAENWQGGLPVTYQYSYWNSYGHEIVDPTYRKFRVLREPLKTTVSVLPTGEDNSTKRDEATYITDSGFAYPSNPRASQTKKFSRNNNGSYTVRTTNFSYLLLDGMSLVQNKDELTPTNTLYRRTTTAYTSYPSQYILGLPQQVSVYNGNNVLLARTTNNYDQTSTFTDSNGQTASHFIDATGDGVIQHSSTYGAGFTQRGNLTSVVQSSVVGGVAGATRTVKRVSYDTNGNVRAVTDGVGNRSQMLYTDYYSNKPGGIGQTAVHVYTAADPTGFRKGSQQNFFTGQKVKSFNLTPGSSTEAQIVTTTYDFADRPLQTTSPDGGWMKSQYWDNWLSQVSSQIIETGKTRYNFVQTDGAGRAYRVARDHPDGVGGKYAGQITVFDKTGQSEDASNTTAITGAWTATAEDTATGFLFTHMTRDELSRLKIVTFPDNNSRQYDYSGCGCAGSSETTMTDEVGHQTITKTDFLGRLTEAIEPNASQADGVYSKAIYIYDELDHLTTINHTKSGGTAVQTRTFSYDGYGRPQSVNTPEGGIVNYTYKANNLIETIANQRGITVTNTYNTRNLLTQVSYSDGTPAAGFGYDAYGARNSMTDGEGAASYTYNSYRQLQSETRTFTGLPGKSFVFTYAYNLADQLKTVNYNFVGGSFNKNVNYTYNAVGALSSVGTNLIGSDPNATTNVLNTTTFRASGALKSQNYGNGRRLQIGYSANRQQPTSIKVDLASNPNDKALDYTYDYYDANGNNNGRLRKITDNLDAAYTTTFTYDDYDRLLTASSTAYSRIYQFDPWGNITVFGGWGYLLNYTTNASGAPATNRIASDSVGTAFSYDAAGNQTAGQGVVYAYDGANRLKTVNGGAATYGYAADGSKARETTGAGPRYYVRSSVLKNVAIEANSTSVLRAYVYAQGKLVAQQSIDGAFYWMHMDHLGSGRKMTDSTGAVKYRSEFDPYGQQVLEWAASGNTNLNRKRFTGYERDIDSGLDYANARMFSYLQGRFMQPDPAGLEAAEAASPQSLNLYAYVNNDPINSNDPSGLGEDLPSGCRINGVWSSQAYCDHALGRENRPKPSKSPFMQAKEKLMDAQLALTERTSFSEDCNSGLAKLGLTPWDLASQAFSVDIKFGTGSSTNIRDAYGSEPMQAQVGRAAQASWNMAMSGYLQNNDRENAQVSDLFINNPGITAWSPWGGGSIYIDHTRFNTKDERGNQALIMHELLHAIYGLDDGAIQEKLGIDPSLPSREITLWMRENCVSGRENK